MDETRKAHSGTLTEGEGLFCKRVNIIFNIKKFISGPEE
jgi:hypothetical protein